MFPELFRLHLPIIGELTITSFGLLMAIAFLAGYQTIRVRLRELDRETEIAGDILLGALVGGMLGAKLYYVALTWDAAGGGLWAALFSRSGLVWYGGLIGGTVVVLLLGRRRGLRFFELGDLVAPALALGHSIGRVGCFLVGDDYGRPTDSWLGVAFPNGYPPTTARNLRRDFGVDIPSAVPDHTILKVYSTQIFEAVLLFGIFLVLWRLRNRPSRSGWLFGLWLVLAGLERFAIEFLRAKDDRFFGPLTLAQVISVAIVVAGLVVMRVRRAPATQDARDSLESSGQPGRTHA